MTEDELKADRERYLRLNQLADVAFADHMRLKQVKLRWPDLSEDDAYTVAWLAKRTIRFNP